MTNRLLASVYVGLIFALAGCFGGIVPRDKPAMDGTPIVTAPVVSRSLASLAVLTTVAGVVMAGFGIGKFGIPVAAGGAITLILVMAIAKYAAFLSLVGLALILGAIAYILFVEAKKYKTGFAEVVTGVEKLKDGLMGGTLRKTMNITLGSVQNPTTQALVAEVKNGTTADAGPATSVAATGA